MARSVSRRRARFAAALQRHLRAPVSLVTTVAFLATSAPVRFAHAGAEGLEAAETPNFSESSSGVAAGGDDAASTAKKTKARSAPVSASGAFTHSIAIQVPPGRLGMTPSLALSYNSGSTTESAVGVGWSFGPATISRSTRLGFPKVNEPIAVRRYDEAAAIFTGPAGEMVPAGNDAPDGTTDVFQPAREGSPVRFERRVADDGWIEHDPSGVKRYYGFDPRDPGNTARIKNELGTHAWLLVREEDEHGNYVAYSYHNAADADRALPLRAQRAPVLARVEWGENNANAATPPPFFVQTTIAPQSGPINMLEGHTVLEDRITKIDVGIDGAVQWSYTLGYTTSETGKQLLTSVSRGGDAPETTTFAYSQGAPAGARFVDQGPIDDFIFENRSRSNPPTTSRGPTRLSSGTIRRDTRRSRRFRRRPTAPA